QSPALLLGVLNEQCRTVPDGRIAVSWLCATLGSRVSGLFPATRSAVLRLRRRAAAPRGLNSIISVIVSQAAIVPAGIGDARLDNAMHQRRCAKQQRRSSGGDHLGGARDQFAEPIGATGFRSSDSKTQKSGRRQ